MRLAVQVDSFHCIKAFAKDVRLRPALNGGIVMRNMVYCCGYDQPCRIFALPSKGKLWRRLYFLDGCFICKRPIGLIVECDRSYYTTVSVRKSGKKAVNLLNLTVKNFDIKELPKNGTYANENLYYNNKGVIYNFNNRRISNQEEFLKRKENK